MGFLFIRKGESMKKVIYPGLVAEMAKRGETQEVLSKLLGLRRESISRRMTGKLEWSISEIDKICEYYKKDYYELFKKDK